MGCKCAVENLGQVGTSTSPQFFFLTVWSGVSVVLINLDSAPLLSSKLKIFPPLCLSHLSTLEPSCLSGLQMSSRLDPCLFHPSSAFTVAGTVY